MAIPVEYIGKQRRWLQAGVPTERANQSMHESSLVVSIANVHASAAIQTVTNSKPIVREPRDRGRYCRPTLCDSTKMEYDDSIASLDFDWRGAAKPRHLGAMLETELLRLLAVQ